MAVRPIMRMGEPVLYQVARPIEIFDTPELHMLLADMRDTMEALNGAGIAAPQIGESVQVVIFEVKNNPRYPDAESIPATVLINPVLLPLSDAIEEGWEGCLSVPGMRGLRARSRRLSRARGAARMRPPEWYSLSHADPGPAPLRLYRGAVSGGA
jgi:peptide deformylase